jgi:hypothetical protein
MHGSFRSKSLGFFLAAVAVLCSVGAGAPTRAQQQSGSQPPDAAASLRAALSDSDAGVREQARWALGVVSGYEWKKR